jgi:S1-C subfamily serine protease
MEENIPAGAGSGFLWDDLGHVVTNCHVVVADTGVIPSRVKVKLQGMAEACDAEVVGVEPEKDLAVLKIPPHNLPTPVAVGTSNDLQVGQKVYAIGNPFGLQSSLTTGVVSAIGRDVQGFGGRQIKGCIQTDAAINPGNSGGPLLDSRGRIIGVNTMIYSPNAVNGIGGNVGIGFAIPVDTVRRVVNEIIRYGRVVRPTLGINAEVIPNSPAERAGLQASQLRGDGSINLGDLITDVDGQPIREVEDLLSAIEEKREGDIVELGIQRFCDPYQQERVSVQLVSRESLQGGFRPAMSAGRNGRPVGRPPWERPPWQ